MRASQPESKVMLVAILSFFFLPFTFAGNADIEECVKLVGNAQNLKRRPTVDSCPEDPVCPSIFVYDNNNLQDLANNFNVYAFFSHYIPNTS